MRGVQWLKYWFPKPELRFHVYFGALSDISIGIAPFHWTFWKGGHSWRPGHHAFTIFLGPICYEHNIYFN